MVLGLHLHGIPIKKEKKIIPVQNQCSWDRFYGSITKSVGHLEMLSGGVLSDGTLQGSD